MIKNFNSIILILITCLISITFTFSQDSSNLQLGKDKLDIQAEIVFYSDRTGNCDIYSINSEGKNLNRLTNNSATFIINILKY